VGFKILYDTGNIKAEIAYGNNLPEKKQVKFEFDPDLKIFYSYPP
jgi:hypothetical protein